VGRVYVSKELRNRIICMLASASMLEEVLEFDPVIFKDVRWRLKTAKTHLYSAADSAMHYVDPIHLEEMQKLVKKKGFDINVRLKHTDNEYVYVNKKVVDRLTKSVLSECATCTAPELGDVTYVRKCQTRKDLIALGVDDRSEGLCPYAIL